MTQQSTPPSNQPSSGNGLKKWILPLVAVVILGVAGMQYLKKNQDAVVTTATDDATETVTDTIADTTTSTVAALKNAAESAVESVSEVSAEALKAAQEAMPAGVDLSGLTDGLQGIFGTASSALASITDADSAKSALPGIEAASEKLGGLSEVITRLPEAAKAPIASIVDNGIAALKPLIDKVTAIPGVAEQVQPVIGPMLEKLQGLTD